MSWPEGQLLRKTFFKFRDNRGSKKEKVNNDEKVVFIVLVWRFSKISYKPFQIPRFRTQKRSIVTAWFRNQIWSERIIEIGWWWMCCVCSRKIDTSEHVERVWWSACSERGVCSGRLAAHRGKTALVMLRRSAVRLFRIVCRNHKSEMFENERVPTSRCLPDVKLIKWTNKSRVFADIPGF